MVITEDEDPTALLVGGVDDDDVRRPTEEDWAQIMLNKEHEWWAKILQQENGRTTGAMIAGLIV
jgi:hypothetical protein